MVPEIDQLVLRPRKDPREGVTIPFLKSWTSMLVRGTFTNPISPPARGTSVEERGSGVFLFQTKEKVDSQCLGDIVLTTFEVALGRGFG
jgi:hypothetical protein